MSIEDKVTLSSAAREPPLPERFRSLSESAHADPKLAEQLASGYANTEWHRMLDFTAFDAGTGPVKYSATGEPVTAESEARYGQQAEVLRGKSSELYELEKSKGTPAADIFDKLLSLINSQPADFRAAINWEGLKS